MSAALTMKNRANDSLRQPGSSFNPYVYATALELGLKPTSIVVDAPICIGNWCPHNYGHGYSGAMTLISALTHSINTIAVRLSVMVGDGPSVNALQSRLGPLGTANSVRDVHQLAMALNKMRRNNRLYVLLMSPQRSFVLHGSEYPSPPPSLLQTFLADPAVAGSARYRGTAVVGDFETKPQPYSMQGQKRLMLKVQQTGP